MSKNRSFQDSSKAFEFFLSGLDHEVKLLKEWFKKDFPESRLDVIVDANNITMNVTITVRVLMGKEMANDRGFFENKIILQEKEVLNTSFMKQFFDAFNWSYRKEISRAINAKYNQEKEWQSSQST